jgi:putative DNA primase/helicase
MLDRSGHEQDRSFYLEAWNGEGNFVYDRIGRGKIFIKNLTVSILGTIQPAMLEPYLRGSLDGGSDDGLIQRFQILVYPETPKTYRYIDRQPKGREKARESFKRLYALSPEDVNAKQLSDEDGGHWFLQFTPEAQEFFQGWLTDLENDLRSGTFETSALESHLAKYRSLMPSLALIFYLLDCVSNGYAGDVTLENAQKAAAWCSYLQKHAERIYKTATLSEFDVAREILKRIKAGQIDDEFTARDIYGKHWSKLSKPKDVQNGLDILTEYGYLTSITINEGHRPKIVYLIQEGAK